MNPALIEVVTQSINILNKGWKTAEENKSYCTASTHRWIAALRREVGLEPRAKIGADRTEALASLYWLPRRLHSKEPPNQISHKSIKEDPINFLELKRSLTKSPNPMLFSISKLSFPKIHGELMPMIGVIKGVITRKDQTKSNPLARVKVYTPKELPASKHGSKMNRGNKSRSWNDKLDVEV